MSLRLGFAGTPDFAEKILEALIHSPHEIVFAITQIDKPKGRGRTLSQSPVKQLAAKHHITILQPKTLRDAQFQSEFRAAKLDALVVAAYGHILPKEVLNIPKYGSINVHASLLPHWRGASPIQSSLLAGDALTGVTIMQMDEGLDTGDILTTYPCPIEIHETSESLHKRLADIGAELLLKTLELIEQNKVVPQKQQDQYASYAPKITKEDAQLNWAETAVQIDRKIRAFNPWPIAFSYLDKVALRIFTSKPLEEMPEETLENQAKNGVPASVPVPGTIVSVNKDSIDVLTGEGILRILELQLPGGKRLSLTALLHSKKDLFTVGKKFESIG